MSPKSPQELARRARPRRWLAEPMLQFLLAGLFLFLAYGALNPKLDAADPSHRIELTEGDLRQMTLAWLAQGRSAPSRAQLEALIAARVREEILYREALALGLEQGDTIVRRRLAQKMAFLTEDDLPVREPTRAELSEWFERHTERFARPLRLSFRHLYFSPDRRGSEAQRDAATALARLKSELRAAAPVADPFMYEDAYEGRPLDQLSMLFGDAFASQIVELPTGSWQGPLESGYGWHLVYIDSRTEPRVPPFYSVASEVREAWIAEQRETAREKAFETLRERYEIVLPPIPEQPTLAAVSR